MAAPGIAPVYGPPKIGSVQISGFRKVFRGAALTIDLSGGKLINGAGSRDPGNTPDIGVLRAGMLMGKQSGAGTNSTAGQYAVSVIGLTTVAYTSGGTSLTVSAAVAAEVVRRIGSSGTFKLIGPPAASGVVGVSVVTYSAVNTTTGVITITSPGVNFVAGSMVCPVDGSEDMITFIPDGAGIPVLDNDGSTNLTAEFPGLPIEGEVISSQLIPWPADTSIQGYIKSKLSGSGYGKFVLDDGY